MNRRDFVRLSTGGIGLAAGVLLTEPGARAAERGSARGPLTSPDPDVLAAAVHRHFLPGKKTCGEAMLLGCCEVLEIESPLVPDVALGMGGGLGLQGHTCGIVTGAAMVIGIVVGSREEEYPKKKMRVFAASGEYVQRFRKAQQTLACREICGLDLTTADGRKKLSASAKAEKCGPAILAGARILGEVLRDDETRPSYTPPPTRHP